MNLNAHDTALLVALRKSNHFKANPGDVTELLKDAMGDVGPSEGQSSARRLHANGLAVFAELDEPSEKTLMRISDDGIAFADRLIEASRKRRLGEHIHSVTRSDWIAIGAFVVSVIAFVRGG
ncbi:MAG: hypothetical protein AAF553_03140 [Pseudomonadota bacterium]